MKNLLKEYVGLMLEKIRSKDFNLALFKHLTEPVDIFGYAQSRLEEMGRGSARIVFALTSHRILKIAKNNKGLGQNEAEVNVYTNPKTKSIVSKIYDYDPDYLWIISELVKPFTEKDTTPIEKILGLGEQSMTWESFIQLVVHGKFKDIEEYGAGHQLEFAKALHALAKENQLIMGDLEKGDSWGVASDGRLVLIDYGFTEDVYSNHYAPKT